VVITGGASGLGAGAAKSLARQGASVAILDLPSSAGLALANQLNTAIFLAVDVTQADQVETAIRCAADRMGGIDVCINAAGVNPAQRMLSRRHELHSLELFRSTIDVNLVGAFDVIRHVVAKMAANTPGTDDERGLIINVASIAALEGQAGQAAYSASKGGIVAMTLPIARELAQFGIRVLTIAPGLFLTPLLANLPQEAQDSLAAAIPFPRRLGHADEFASLALHMIDNPYLNGEVVRLDAALRMAPR
jgi:NAD(P)-dependent dehydrogenase (short-subunit alcohol dehydrogenase family)